jgi:predicted secreted Zn-dependent protease
MEMNQNKPLTLIDVTSMVHTWKSSYSGQDGGNCVVVGAETAAVFVGDSKVPDRQVLTVAPSTWSDFVAMVTRA